MIQKEIKTTYTYYDDSRLPKNIEVAPKLGGGFTTDVETVYNTYGLPTTVTTSSQGESRTIETTYSNDGNSQCNDGYFVYKVTNDLDHSVTTKTYPEHGQVKEVIDANDLITKTEYDAFGRIEKVTPPLGTGQPAYSRFANCLGGCDDITYISPTEIGSNELSNIASLIAYKVTTYSAGSPETTLYKDKFNRVLVAVTEGFDGSSIIVRTEYDELGRKVFESIPYFLIDETLYKDKGTHWIAFDAQGRLLEKKIDQPDRFGNPQSFTTTYSYSDHDTTIQAVGSTGKTLEMSRTYNGIGQLMKTEDAIGGLTEYAYDAQGNPIVLQDANNNPITAEYNALGQKKYVIDPNMGRKDFEYTAFGEIYREKDANNDSYYYDYDVLGRLTNRYLNVIPSASNQHLSEASFEFDGVCKGAIDREVREDLTGGENFSRDYYYDSSCRGSSMTTTIDGVSYTQATQYDSFYGRVKGSQTVSGITLETQYNDFGYATKSLNAASGYVYQEVTDMDARLQLIAANKANGEIIETRKYSEITGQMELVKAETLSQMQRHRIAYEYDDFGNLVLQNVEEMLSDFSVNVFDETYRYDNLHRLVESKRTASGAEDILNYNYDAVGNITVKDDFSTNFTYGNLARNNGNAGPNAVRQVVKTSEFNNEVVTYGYDLNGNMTSGDGRTITYNAFNKPVSIVKGSITSLFSYDSGQMRYKQIKQGLSGGDETTIYIDKSYEEITHNGVTKKRSYLGDAIVTETIGGTEAGFKVGFVHRDRLGSVVTITNEQGAVEDNKSFDPFGKVRKGDMELVDPGSLATLSVVADLGGYDLLTNRGFTDHEHLDDAELIHMNGRVYDYNLGRFLSVDPFIQEPGNSQSMNPYSYIMNNPLAGTDPSGYLGIVAASVDCDEYDCGAILSGSSAKGAKLETDNGNIVVLDGNHKKDNEEREELESKGYRVVQGYTRIDGTAYAKMVRETGGTLGESTSQESGGGSLWSDITGFVKQTTQDFLDGQAQDMASSFIVNADETIQSSIRFDISEEEQAGAEMAMTVTDSVSTVSSTAEMLINLRTLDVKPSKEIVMGSISLLVKDGAIDMTELLSYVPDSAKNIFRPNDRIPAGQKFKKFKIGDVPVQIKFHSPDLGMRKSKPRSNAARVWTA